MNREIFTLSVLAFVALIVYLFVDAPPPLPDVEAARLEIPIEDLLAIAEAENDVVRALWTQEIVGAGKRVGLEFSEDWRDKAVDAGPLPALFLRETSASLEKKPVRLGLFLGSDFPINDANRFTGRQMEIFRKIKKNLEPQFFYSDDTDLHMAMFPDLAAVDSCVECHNDHEQSPKNDWRLNDVMGATTWSYPEKAVSLSDSMSILASLRASFEEVYSVYLRKAETFRNKPDIGQRWPRDGYFLPAEEIFMEEVFRRASPATLEAIIKASTKAADDAENSI